MLSTMPPTCWESSVGVTMGMEVRWMPPGLQQQPSHSEGGVGGSESPMG